MRYPIYWRVESRFTMILFFFIKRENRFQWVVKVVVWLRLSELWHSSASVFLSRWNQHYLMVRWYCHHSSVTPHTHDKPLIYVIFLFELWPDNNQHLVITEIWLIKILWWCIDFDLIFFCLILDKLINSYT